MKTSPAAPAASTPPVVDIVETPLLPAGRPFHRRRLVANSWWAEGTLVTPLVTGADTHGAFALLDMSLRRGAELPPHTHQHEDETIFVLEGQLRCHVGDEVLHATAGDAVHLPRGLGHSCCLETDYARILLHISPAGFEHFYLAQAAPAQALLVPPPPSQPDVPPQLPLYARFGVTLG